MDILEIEKLVLKAKNNNPEAYELLFCTFMPYITIWCSKLRIPNYTFDDLKQECFLYLVHAIEKYNCTNNTFVAYATKTIKNNLLYLLREQVKEIQLPHVFPYLEYPDITVDTVRAVENFVLRNIEESIIVSALNSLTRVEKKIITDYYYNDLNLVEISKNLDMKYITTVKKKDKALSKLHILLDREL